MTDQPTKKSLGQHWLHDNASLEAMCDAADIAAGDVVLEIGPGTGTLTERLLARGAEVIALEYDTSLTEGLAQKFGHLPASRFFIQEGDIRTYDLNNLPDNYKIVANIPYYLSANLLRILTESKHKPSVAALLVQKEVAERVAAKPGSMSFISVAVQFYYDAKLGAEVPARLFTPPPKVDSKILVLNKRATPLFSLDEKMFFRIIKAGFSNRRKTLLNSLSAGLRVGKAEIKDYLKVAGINPQSRPQELSLDEWHSVFSSIASK